MKTLFPLAVILGYFLAASAAFGQSTVQEIGPVETEDGVVQIIVFFPEKVGSKMMSAQDRANEWLKGHRTFFIEKTEVGISINEKLRSGIEAFQCFVAITYREPTDKDVAEHDSKDPPPRKES